MTNFKSNDSLEQQRRVNAELTDTNEQMLLALKTVKRDFEMLLSGDWDGSQEGCKASLEGIDTAIDKAERTVRKQQRQKVKGQGMGM
ncbi:MAG: hypothetical protein GXP26_13225 [Planctomycetes bacterium]|nr:hypothetical protein [Planctomycetota bacterium]